MRTLEVTLPRPLEWQAQVKAERRRYNTICVGRRAGKTVLLQDLCVEPEVLPYPVGWFAPSYKDMLEVWREVSARLAPIATRVNASDRRIENVAGGVLEFWSLDNVNAGRGRKYRRVVVDECAFVPNLMDAWNFSIRPTLVDYTGDAWFASTPKGRNGFWQLWQMEASGDPDWRSWQMPSSVNPKLPASELDAMRKTMPERVYQQEIEAAFLDDAGGIFLRVMAAATAEHQDAPNPDHTYAMGVDWAREKDWTVLTVIDVTTKSIATIDRFNQIDYVLQMGRLKAMVNRFHPKIVFAEENSMGAPLIDVLRRSHIPIQPFTTTNATKFAIIDALSQAFAEGEIRIIPDQTLINELQSFEQEKLPSGVFRFSAPEGMHDDMVMSLALAWQAVPASRAFGVVPTNPFYE